MDPMSHGLNPYNIGYIEIESNLSASKLDVYVGCKIQLTYVDPILDDP